MSIGIGINMALQGGLLGAYAYTRLVKSVFGASLIEHWAGAEASGTTALAEVSTARNGTYTAVTLAQPGIGDGRTAGLYVPASSSRNNIYSASLDAAFNTGNAGTALQWLQSNTWDATTRYSLYIQGPTNANNIHFRKSTTNTQAFNYVAGGVTQSFVATVTDTTSFYPIAITWELSPSNAVYAYLRGQRVGFLGALGTWVGPITNTVCVIGAQTGSGGANPWDGKIAHTAIGNTALASPDIALLHRIAGHVLVEGDSRSDTGTYPELMRPSIPGFGWWEVASGGATIVTTLTGRAAANIAAYKRSGLAKNVVVIWAGINDANAGTSEATFYAALVTLCQTYRAAGFKVVVCTEIDCQSSGLNAVNWHSTMWPLFNTDIRNNWTTFADALADLGGNANLQDATNTTYFNADKTHLVAAGNTVVAGVVAAAVNAL